MHIFSSLRLLVPHWVAKSSRYLTYEEVQSVLYAEIVPADYWPSVKFHLNTGKSSYIPLSSESTANIGDIVDPSEIRVLTLVDEWGDQSELSSITRILL